MSRNGVVWWFTPLMQGTHAAERGLGMMMGSSMAWLGPSNHEEDFADMFFRSVQSDGSIFMIDSAEHVQDST